MVLKTATCLLILPVISACTTMKYNGSSTYVKSVDYPPVGQEITAYIGDHLVKKGTVTEVGVLNVLERIDGFGYQIPAKMYEQTGSDRNKNYFSAVGIEKALLADPYQGMYVEKNNRSEICVITMYGASSCFKGKFKIDSKLSEQGNSFQQTLIYSGKVGNKINISYREFSNNLARPAFNNSVEYDLSESNIIGYKGAELEIIKADNRSITYRVLRNFPESS